eukprot:gb/GEZN01006847.1/.p1 GENE.gb/GEZN01006847.1/~~gb/GEZN01006847.1/.p1  ORF type:complete len:439 (-),score=47.71 gb/GEZN01006847.1/:269-1585(-)
MSSSPSSLASCQHCFVRWRRGCVKHSQQVEQILFVTLCEKYLAALILEYLPRSPDYVNYPLDFVESISAPSFQEPMKCIFHPNGKTILVVNTFASRVQEHKLVDGAYVRDIGKGEGETGKTCMPIGDFDRPWSGFTNGHHVFTSCCNHRVQKFDYLSNTLVWSAGKASAGWGGDSDGEFSFPKGVCAIPARFNRFQEDVVAVIAGSNRITFLSLRTGEFLDTTSTLGLYCQAHDIGLNSQGELLLVGQFPGVVVVCSVASQPPSSTSQPHTLTSQSPTLTSQSLTLTSQPPSLNSQPPTSTSQPARVKHPWITVVRRIGEGVLAHPGSIAVDAEDNILVSDLEHRCVFLFDPDGQLLNTFFKNKLGKEQGNRGCGVDFHHASQTLAVTDRSSSTIHIVRDPGRKNRETGKEGKEAGRKKGRKEAQNKDNNIVEKEDIS